MKIHLQKKSFIKVLIAIGGILLLLLLYFALLQPIIKQNNLYNNLFEYCSDKDQNIKECKIFLGNIYENDKKQNCLQLVVPALNPSERDIDICLNKNKINWENPYDNYNLNIPVVVNIFYKKFLTFTNITNVDMALMSDEEAYAIADPIRDQTDGILQFVSASAMQEYRDKGYNLSPYYINEEESIQIIRLFVFDVDILDYQVDSDQISIRLKMHLYGKDIEKIFKVKEFQFQKYTYAGTFIEGELINRGSDLNQKLDKNNDYSAELLLTTNSDNIEDLVQSFAVNDTNLDLRLNKIIVNVQ